MTLKTLKPSISSLSYDDGLRLILSVRQARRTWVSKKIIQRTDSLVDQISKLDPHSRAAVLTLVKSWE